MKCRRVALIFDNQARPETTGVYCHRALRQLVDVEHFLPCDVATIPRHGFDLYLAIDDGLRYELPDELRPSAWWAIDTHLNLDWCLKNSRRFDTVFAAQRDGAERLLRGGISTAKWLPLACDPYFHKPHATPKIFDLAFIGNLFPGDRGELVELLRSRHPSFLLGQRYFEEMAHAYSQSRLVFNRSIRNDINMRVFEAVACGSLLLTNDLTDNGQAEIFSNEEHLVTYESSADLLSKVDFYLRHEARREQIAKAGRAEAVARHTYQHRMEQILRDVERETSRTSVAVPGLEQSAPKDPVYFDHLRPEVLALIPTSARRILDIGCGTGRLGEAVKDRQEAHVSGIELDGRAAAKATARLDVVWNQNIEEKSPPIEGGSLDCVVCADVLEHLREPLAVLNQLRSWLSPDGTVVASIPNVRHHSVIRSLLAGNWTYESAGLLDATHLRFFTRREIEKLFYRAGFTIEELQIVPGPGHAEWAQSGQPGEVRMGHLVIQGLKASEAEEFYAYQYLVRARPRPAKNYGLTSIVILTYNQLEFTRLCLESIRRYTDEPYELIFVDNASTDGTVDYLKSFPDIHLVLNSENRGFPAAANQGIQAAKGDQILLLNNDVVLTTGWLDRLLRALHHDPQIGIVGPCSNCVSGAQEVPVTYENLSELDGFAWDWSAHHDREYIDSDRLIGFCFLLRRELVQSVGLLDERFGTGCFEDDDYCRRALRAGYRLVNARDCFVHHFGGRTFLGAGVDYGSLIQENQQRYREKWSEIESENPLPKRPSNSQIAEAARQEPRFSLRKGEGLGLRLQHKAIKISLCLICRDNEQTIEPCLSSIRPWVDEMVVVDTGSKDSTPEIARQLGAKVFYFPWCDDFSAARNESLRHAQGEWLFWMDSDDTISDECGRLLRQTVDQHLRDEVLGYVVQVHCPGKSPGDVTAVDHVKLIRNRPDLRFEGRIHEQIIPSIRQAGGEVGWTDAYVVHSGSDRTPEGHRRKIERDLRILKKDLEERPNHTFVLFNLGMTYADDDSPSNAVSYLQRSIAAASPGESHLRKAYALLVSNLSRSSQIDEAIETCELSCRLYPDDSELHFHRGVLAQQAGRLEDAENAFLLALREGGERHFSSLDQGISGYKARHNLAIVYVEMKDSKRAEQEWRLVIEQMPTYREAWIGLGRLLLEQESYDALDELGKLATTQTETFALATLWHAQILKARGNISQAVTELKAAICRFGDDIDLRNALCLIYFEIGECHRAEAHLQKVLDLDPEDASAHHNLGSIFLSSSRPTEAQQCYARSLKLRPTSSATWLQYGYAHRMLGDLSQAARAFEEAYRLDPQNREAEDVLRQMTGPNVVSPNGR